MQAMKYLGLIGLAIFAYIVYAIGLDKIIASLAGLDLFYFALAVLILVPSVLVKAWKQSLLIQAFGARLSILENAKIWLIGFAFSVITPGRTGNLLKAFYFADKSDISAGKGLAAAVVERVFDVAFLFLFALLGFFFLSLSLLFSFDLTLVVVFFAAFVVLAFLLSRKEFTSLFAKPLFRFFVPEKFKAKLEGGFDQFYEGVEFYKRDKILMFKVAALTVVSWVIVIAHYYLLALALNLSVSFLFLFAIMPIVLLLSTLPIAFSGVGTRDASLILFFALKGLEPSLAVSFAFLILLMNLLLGAIGFLFIQGEKKHSL